MRVKKTREQMIADNMWASPSLFCFAALVCFSVSRTDPSFVRTGWMLYFSAWVLPLCMTVWCLVKRRPFGVGGAFSAVCLIVCGAVFYLVKG